MRRLSILSLLNQVGETSAPYNQFALPTRHARDITICSYFPPTLSVAPEITLCAGDGTVGGYFRALGAALRARDHDIVQSHAPQVGTLFLLANIVHRRSLRTTVFVVHNSYQNFKPRNKLLLLPMFALFQTVVCCGRASYDSFPRPYRWLAGNRLCFVPNGVDTGRIDRALRASGPPDTRTGFTILSVGRLIPIKNPATLLAAFRQAGEPASLVFVGDGPLREELGASGRALGVEPRVEFTGLIPRDAVFARLRGADLFASTSRGEGLPIATLEAMTCGCPVLLSDIPPHREIADGVDFIPLVEPDDAAGFAREIRRFMDMPPSERTEIGRRCRALVDQRFSLAAMHRGYEALYVRLLANRPHRRS
jgi:glycosyltransferase involved in cell wall biosynthesis